MTATTRTDRVRTAAAIARLALQQIQDETTGDIAAPELAAIVRELHDEADPPGGVLGALAQLLTRTAQAAALTPGDTDDREAAACALEEAAAFITDSAGMRLHLATRTLHPQGERP
ncbi:hypothetical protein V1L54_27205 [Streptomyces sp. TRM 70361]|uniref:hypothetical protein n=1 Tax=Streptomyces sp. TRM 70361 TaxID=3116553 RepID=UPI002E7C543F|nr:hypothetical protein [Streptomyces sp. TRM 70361]MEE1943049.1 hypothetical protein [Streptomyces sp. TRM 70361]